MLSKRLLVLMVSVFLLASLGSFSVVAAGASDQMKTMAKIMHRLKHYPSPEGKAELQGVVDNKKSSDHERVLAQAMINLEHTVNPADKPKLQAIIDDSAASQGERDLAGIILNLNHRPSEEDKKKLENLM
jgi:hypothetical protein